VQPDAARPGLHPDPPVDLSAHELPIVEVASPWFRIHACHREPLHCGDSGRNRFDAPAREFGILYVGGDEHCAFIETFGQSTGLNLLEALALTTRCLARVEAGLALAIVDLTAPGLARLGADERLCAGEHRVAQRWSLALWARSSQPDGLLYRARHDPSRFSLALYDRVAPILRAVALGGLLDTTHRSLLAVILGTYGFGLIDR
jgi:hypothetical protein